MFSHLSHFFKNTLSRTIGSIFVGEGFLFGTWAAFIPIIKYKFGLDDAQLGLVLLSLPAGITITNPLSVLVMHRLGIVNATIGCLICATLLFILPVAAASVPWLCVGLFVAGAAFSATNVAMNTGATMMESHQKTRIMSTCHGLWSFGAMLGSAIGGISFGWGIIPVLHFAIVALFIVLLAIRAKQPMDILTSYEQIDKKHENATDRKFMMPSAALWAIIIISLCVNLTEGTLADWAGVYMRDVVHATIQMSGWGFAAYAFFMAGGRFIGDAILNKYGDKQVLMVGGLICTLGFTISVVFPIFPMVLLGFALIGAGVSLGAPILYAAASRVPGMAPGAGLATMNTFAMVGFLGGPAVIGFLAKIWSLGFAFSVVAGVGLFWTWRARSFNNNPTSK